MDFESIYKEYFNPVFNYIMIRVQNEPLAEDLAASVWQKVLRKLDTFDANKGNLRQWLFGIARNEINMHYRLAYIRKIFSLCETEEQIPSPEQDAYVLLRDEEKKKALLGAVKTLGQREQDLLSLKFYSGLNNREIAALLRISESNAGTIIYRGLEKLRALLEE